MRFTAILCNYCIRTTLFTRQNCSLCDDAKRVLSGVWDKRPFEYDEVDIMKPHNTKWKALYEFDTPVVHIDKAKENDSKFETTAQARKLMHRFKEQDVEKIMEEEMMKPPDYDEKDIG